MVQYSLTSGDMLVKIWHYAFEVVAAEDQLPQLAQCHDAIQSENLMYLPQSSVCVCLSWNINGTEYDRAKFIERLKWRHLMVKSSRLGEHERVSTFAPLFTIKHTSPPLVFLNSIFLSVL